MPASRTASSSYPGCRVAGVVISHPEKVLWPGEGITKLDLARYYERVGPTLLKYAAHRPLTLRPFPRGIDHPGFYLKRAPAGRPSWISTWRDVATSARRPLDYVVATQVRTLVWLAQYNAIEVHAWLSRIDRPERPDWAVIDLDPPSEPDAAGWQHLVQAAQAAREWLEARGLRAFPKLSGQTGLHLLVPLLRVHDFETVRRFFATLAHELCAILPDVLTTEYETAARQGRILIDYAQNAYGKSTVAPYSVRPRPGAPVAAPVTWEELDDPQLRSNRWTLRTIEQRLQQAGDVLAPALQLRQRLPRAIQSPGDHRPGV